MRQINSLKNKFNVKKHLALQLSNAPPCSTATCFFHNLFWMVGRKPNEEKKEKKEKLKQL